MFNLCKKANPSPERELSGQSFCMLTPVLTASSFAFLATQAKDKHNTQEQNALLSDDSSPVRHQLSTSA